MEPGLNLFGNSARKEVQIIFGSGVCIVGGSLLKKLNAFFPPSLLFIPFFTSVFPFFFYLGFYFGFSFQKDNNCRAPETLKLIFMEMCRFEEAEKDVPLLSNCHKHE